MGTRCADHVTPLYPQKLALTSPTAGGRSAGIVRVRTKATEFSFSSSITFQFLAIVFQGLHWISAKLHLTGSAPLFHLFLVGQGEIAVHMHVSVLGCLTLEDGKTVPIGDPETSVINHESTLRNSQMRG